MTFDSSQRDIYRIFQNPKQSHKSAGRPRRSQYQNNRFIALYRMFSVHADKSNIYEKHVLMSNGGDLIHVAEDRTTKDCNYFS